MAVSSGIRRRVVEAAEIELANERSVVPIHVFGRMGWLPAPFVDEWRQGRRPNLEDAITAGRQKRDAALWHLQEWAREHGMRPSETAYVASTRDRRPLRFTADGDEAAERAYRTHWLSADLTEKQVERMAERQSRAPDLVVVQPLNDWTCALCEGTGGLLIMEQAGPVCMECAELDHLVFLPSGDATLTRRAKKASGLSAVVVRFSRSRRRYERQGALVEEAALERAEAECLADEDARARQRERAAERRVDEDAAFHERMAREIAERFPGCPPGRAEAIARHAGLRGSGRVGRTAAGRALREDVLTLAVVASIRHEDTPYDELLMSGVPRDEARARVGARVDAILRRWRG
jgi:hypothetical protein